jgi:5-methylcytosine-specific restriction endonuclease McrA
MTNGTSNNPFLNFIRSSIGAIPGRTRDVWITLLAYKDDNGLIDADRRFIAHMSGVTAEECEAALQELSTPQYREPAHIEIISNREIRITYIPKDLALTIGRDDVNAKSHARECKRRLKAGLTKPRHRAADTRKAYLKFLASDFWIELSQRKKGIEGKCEECGSTNGLSAHHLFYRENWYDTQIGDLKVLCRSCHRKAHSQEPSLVVEQETAA